MWPLRDTKFLFLSLSLSLFSLSLFLFLSFSHVQKYFNYCSHGLNIFQRSLRNFRSPRGRVISSIYAHLVFLPLYKKHFFYQKLFQNLRCILYTESFVSGAVVDPVLYWYMLNASDWIPHNFIILFFQLTCGKTWEHISTSRSSLRKNSQIFCVLCCVCDAGNFANSMLSIEHLAPRALTKHVA